MTGRIRFVRASMLLIVLAHAACHAQPGPKSPARPTPSPSPSPPTAQPTPTSGSGQPTIASGPFVTAWSEPRTLPPGGGAAQILIRVKKKGGAAYVGVQVKLEASEGKLFSGGRVLKTDARGMVRDRITTTKTSTITINAGGSVQRLWVAVGDFSR